MKGKFLLIGLMAVFCMTSCSKDNDDQPIGGNGFTTEGTMELSRVSQQDFSGFVSNNIFQFDSYSLSNDEAVAYAKELMAK